MENQQEKNRLDKEFDSIMTKSGNQIFDQPIEQLFSATGGTDHNRMYADTIKTDTINNLSSSPMGSSILSSNPISSLTSIETLGNAAPTTQQQTAIPQVQQQPAYQNPQVSAEVASFIQSLPQSVPGNQTQFAIPVEMKKEENMIQQQQNQQLAADMVSFIQSLPPQNSIQFTQQQCQPPPSNNLQFTQQAPQMSNFIQSMPISAEIVKEEQCLNMNNLPNVNVQRVQSSKTSSPQVNNNEVKTGLETFNSPYTTSSAQSIGSFETGRMNYNINPSINNIQNNQYQLLPPSDNSKVIEATHSQQLQLEAQVSHQIEQQRQQMENQVLEQQRNQQMETQRLQLEAQLKQQQIDTQMHNQQVEQQRLQLEAQQRQHLEAQMHNQHVEQQRMQLEAQQIEQQRMQLEAQQRQQLEAQLHNQQVEQQRLQLEAQQRQQQIDAQLHSQQIEQQRLQLEAQKRQQLEAQRHQQQIDAQIHHQNIEAQRQMQQMESRRQAGAQIQHMESMRQAEAQRQHMESQITMDMRQQHIQTFDNHRPTDSVGSSAAAKVDTESDLQKTTSQLKVTLEITQNLVLSQSVDSLKEQFATHIEESTTRIIMLENALKHNSDTVFSRLESLSQQHNNTEVGLKNAFIQIDDTRHHIAKTHAIVVQNLRPLLMQSDGYSSDVSRRNFDAPSKVIEHSGPSQLQQVINAELPSATSVTTEPQLNGAMLSKFAAGCANAQMTLPGDQSLKRCSINSADFSSDPLDFKKMKAKKKPKNLKTSLFTQQEDEILLKAVEELQDSWHEVADRLPPHDAAKCKARWLEIKPAHLEETPHRKDSTRWQRIEDLRIVQSKQRVDNEQSAGIVYDSLTAFWSRVALGVPGRTAAQCQARYNESLDPQVMKGQWTQDEIDKLKDGVRKFGQSWCKIGLHVVPGRTQRQCRGRFQSFPDDVQKELLASYNKNFGDSDEDGEDYDKENEDDSVVKKKRRGNRPRGES